jgi:hypothetical protein
MTLIAAITPRGGIPGDTIVIDGTAFGPLQGSLTIDGQTVTVISAWSDIQVTCVVPPGVSRDGNYILRLVTEDLTGFDEEQFWIPAVDPFTADLDYQLPSSETGPTQNIDLPRRAEAALFNRILDQLRTSNTNSAVTLHLFTPVILDQTVFILPSTPTNPGALMIFIEGVMYTAQSGFFTLVGSTITWLDIPFSIPAGARVEAVFQ